MQSERSLPKTSHSEKCRRWKYVARSMDYRCRQCGEYVGFDDRDTYFNRGTCKHCARH